MTCIAGVVDDSGVHLGGDTAALAGWTKTRCAESKVFRVGPYLIGAAQSIRAAQLLRHSFEAPEPPESGDLDRFLCTTFIEAVRDCFERGGFAVKEDEEETQWSILLGIRGRLYYVTRDFQVSEAGEGYAAIGCGQDFALGSLFTTLEFRDDPLRRLRRALEAAAEHSAGVNGPFSFISENPPIEDDTNERADRSGEPDDDGPLIHPLVNCLDPTFGPYLKGGGGTYVLMPKENHERWVQAGRPELQDLDGEQLQDLDGEQLQDLDGDQPEEPFPMRETLGLGHSIAYLAGYPVEERPGSWMEDEMMLRSVKFGPDSTSGQNPVPGGLIGRAGVEPTSSSHRTYRPSYDSEFLAGFFARLEEFGECVDVGSVEFRRIHLAWIEAGKPKDVAAFIKGGQLS